MKCFLALCTCVLLLGGAAVVNAETISAGTVTQGNLSVGYTLTDYDANPNYKVLTAYLTGLSGAASGSQCLLIQGTWTVNNGTMLLSSSTSTNTWTTAATTVTGGNGKSYVNFSGRTSYTNPIYWSRVGSGSNYSSLTGSWTNNTDSNENLSPALSTSDLDEDGLTEDIIGVFYVSKDFKSLTFDGKMGYNYGSGTNEFTTFTVPEPSTIVLLGVGLLSLVAYAWRKRK